MWTVHKLLIVLFVCFSIVGCNSRENVPEKKAAAVDANLAKQASAKLIQQGADFLNQQDVAKAIVSFEGAIQVDPANLQPYMLLAELLMKMKSYPQAILVLERAVGVFPDNGFVFYMLSLANQGNQTPLPAVLAARRSAELFQAQKNEEGYKRSMLLMESLIKTEQQKQNSQSGQTDGSKPQQPTVDSF